MLDKYQKLQVKVTYHDVLIHRNTQKILCRKFPVLALVADPIPAAVTPKLRSSKNGYGLQHTLQPFLLPKYMNTGKTPIGGRHVNRIGKRYD